MSSTHRPDHLAPAPETARLRAVAAACGRLVAPVRWVLPGTLVMAHGLASAADRGDTAATLWGMAIAAPSLLGLTWMAVCSHRRARRRARDAALRGLLMHSPFLTAHASIGGQIDWTSDLATQWIGRTPAMLAGVSLADALGVAPGHELADTVAHCLRLAALGQHQQFEADIIGGDAVTRRLQFSLRPLRDERDDVNGLLIEARDISVKYRNEEKLRLAAAVFEQAREGFLITGRTGDVVAVNQAFTEITGYGADELEGQSALKFAPGLSDPQLLQQVLRALHRSDHWSGEMLTARKDGSSYTARISVSRQPDSEGLARHLIVIVNDISRERHIEQVEQQLYSMEHFDPLTGLPNRLLLSQRLHSAVRDAQRNDEKLALLYLDLDHFRRINDTLSHRAGDQLLVQMSAMMREELREADTIARLGDDEFAVLLRGTSASGAAKVAEKLLKRLSQPLVIEGHELCQSQSIGIAMYPDDGLEAEVLQRAADAAAFRAKQEGRATYRFYTANMQQRSPRQLMLEAALRRAVERNELLLHYQPQLNARTGKLVGLEALVRWRHPELGMISPGEFIPLAETSGQIIPIGEWVMQEALRQLKEWTDAGMPAIVMAVNLSAAQFREPRLPEHVMQIVEQSGVPPNCLELELTESVASGDPQAAVAMMDRLHALGVRLSIDDFGTHYSALNHLKRFRIHTLKIDQSFVRDIAVDPEDRAIVQAVIQMAHALRLSTVAEGVETEEQAQFLRDHDCDTVQGYRHCRPLPADEIRAWMNRHIAQHGAVPAMSGMATTSADGAPAARSTPETASSPA